MVIPARSSLLLVWSWVFRFIHIALDTMVLHSVLRENVIDERGGGAASSSASPEHGPGPESQPMPARPRLSTVSEGSVSLSNRAPDLAARTAPPK